MRTSENIIKIAASLLKAQKNMGAAVKDSKNPFFKSKYADLGAVMEVVKEPLNDEGVIVLQPVWSRDGATFVETILVHESGEFIATGGMKLTPSKESDMQALGSSVSYGKRYQLQSLLFIPSEDDDGNASVGKASVPKQENPFAEAPLSEPVKKGFGNFKAKQQAAPAESLF